MNEDAALLLSRWQREAEPDPLVIVAESLRDCGSRIWSIGRDIEIRLDGPTEHHIRDLRSAVSEATRALRQLEDRT